MNCKTTKTLNKTPKTAESCCELSAADIPDNGRTLVVIPTYCESDNINSIVPAVLALRDDIDVLVVDDNSPDGTANIVREIAKKSPRVKLKVRASKAGLGTAYIEGFRTSIRENYRNVMQIDADFSHEYKIIPELIICSQTADMVIASRYVQGGSTTVWSLGRRLLSFYTNLGIRFIVGLRVRDITAGFKCINVKALSKIDLDQLECKGFGFQCELIYWAARSGLRIIEFPTTFIGRKKGKSKMSFQIALEALWKLPRLRFIKG